MDFTFEEMNLICIYNTGTREGLISELREMLWYLEADESELRDLTDSTLSKLEGMSDEGFAEVKLVPDFGI